jgi:bacteriocin-like protein
VGLAIENVTIVIVRSAKRWQAQHGERISPADTMLLKPRRVVMSKARNPGGTVPENLVPAGPDAVVELSETELAQVSGGGKSKGAKPKVVDGETSDYLVVTLTDASIT